MVDWFLQYDDKIADLRARFPRALSSLRDEIIAEVAQNPTLMALQNRIAAISKLYDDVLRALCDVRGPQDSGADPGYAESSCAAKLRILGYFLVRRHGVQPTP